MSQIEKVSIVISRESLEGVWRCTRARRASRMFKLGEADFVEQVDGVLTIGEFYELAAGGEIIFT